MSCILVDSANGSLLLNPWFCSTDFYAMILYYGCKSIQVTRIWLENFLKGFEVYTDLVHSLMVLIYHSTSGTCSSFDTIFRDTPRKIAICSNSPSPSMCVISKPKCVYILMIFLGALYIDLKVWSDISYADPIVCSLKLILKIVWYWSTLCQLPT